VTGLKYTARDILPLGTEIPASLTLPPLCRTRSSFIRYTEDVCCAVNCWLVVGSSLARRWLVVGPMGYIVTK
jgi:hypothetical protein